MTVNNDMLDLANDIKAIKETVRQAIENKGVSCDTSVPFNKYPNKISQVGQDVIWARNDLKSEPQTDDKVWVSPVNYNQDEYYSFKLDSQFGQFHMLYMVPLIGYDCIFQCRSTYNTTYGYNCLWSLDPTTGTMTSVGLTNYYSSSGYGDNCTDTDQSTNNFGANIWMFSPYITVSKTKYNSSSSSSYMYHATIEYKQFIHSMTTSISRSKYYIPNQWTIQDDNKLYKTDEFGIKSSEAYGTLVSPPTDHYYAGDGFIVTNDGKYIVEVNHNAGSGNNLLYYFRHVLNTDTGQFNRSTHSISGLPTFGYYYQCIGVTSDAKYAFFQGYNINNGYTPLILRVSAIGYLSLANDLPITLDTYNCLTWYPDQQLLFVSHNNNTLSIYRYDETLGFVEEGLDLGDIIPRNNQRVGKNYDGTLISLQDTNSYLYVLRLTEVAEHKFKATPFLQKNFLTTSFTGILTGNKNDEDGTVEVIATLPPEYKVEATVETEDDNVEIIAES